MEVDRTEMLLISAVAVVTGLLMIAFRTFAHLDREPVNVGVTEPSELPSRLPYIGHVLGLLRHGLKYYSITR